MNIICKNCNCNTHGNYCSNCGQRNETARLTWRNFVDNVFYGIINADRGIWHTIKMLFLRPGTLFKDYLAGRRVTYFRPFSLLIVLAGFYEILYRIAGMYWKPAEVVKETLQGTDFASLLWNSLGNWINSSIAFTAILMLPLYAYAMKRTFRKNERVRRIQYTMIEYIYISVYMSCQRLLISIPLIPLKVHGEIQQGWYVFVTYTLFVAIMLVNVKQFLGLTWKKSWVKTIKLYVRLGVYLIVAAIILGLFLFLIISAVTMLFDLETSTRINFGKNA